MKPGIDYTGVCVIMLCHDGKGNLLMHRRSQSVRDEKGVWDCGGGKVEYGEDLSQAVLREVKEEYGCEGAIDLQLPSYSIVMDRNGQSNHWIGTPFIVRVDSTEVRCNEPDMLEEVQWFSLAVLPEPRHPGLNLILERYKADLSRFFS